MPLGRRRAGRLPIPIRAARHGPATHFTCPLVRMGRVRDDVPRAASMSRFVRMERRDRLEREHLMVASSPCLQSTMKVPEPVRDPLPRESTDTRASREPTWVAHGLTNERTAGSACWTIRSPSARRGRAVLPKRVGEGVEPTTPALASPHLLECQVTVSRRPEPAPGPDRETGWGVARLSRRRRL